MSRRLTAIWQPGALFWELLITDEKGNLVRAKERTTTSRFTPPPGDGYLATLGYTPVGEWQRDGGSWSCPVVASGAWDVSRFRGPGEDSPPGA